jgi:hypothetical protein
LWWIAQRYTACEKTKTQEKIQEINKFSKWTSSQYDNQHNPHRNTRKEKEKRRPKIKDQTQV